MHRRGARATDLSSRGAVAKSEDARRVARAGEVDLAWECDDLSESLRSWGVKVLVQCCMFV